LVAPLVSLKKRKPGMPAGSVRSRLWETTASLHPMPEKEKPAGEGGLRLL
jgi:hypothetical protein